MMGIELLPTSFARNLRLPGPRLSFTRDKVHRVAPAFTLKVELQQVDC